MLKERLNEIVLDYEADELIVKYLESSGFARFFIGYKPDGVHPIYRPMWLFPDRDRDPEDFAKLQSFLAKTKLQALLGYVEDCSAEDWAMYYESIASIFQYCEISNFNTSKCKFQHKYTYEGGLRLAIDNHCRRVADYMPDLKEGSRVAFLFNTKTFELFGIEVNEETYQEYKEMRDKLLERKESLVEGNQKEGI